MNLLSKILLVVLALVIVGFGIFVFIKEKQIATMQSSINTQMIAQQTLLNGLVRSSTTYATTSDIAALAQQEGVNLSAIQSNLATINATLVGLNSVVINSQGQNQTNLPSTGTSANPTPPPTTTTVTCTNGTANCPGPVDVNHYTQNIQTLALNEEFSNISVPESTVSFDASKAAPWTADVYARTYNLANTVGQNPDTGETVVYNELSINTNGKDYTIPITKASFVQAPQKSSFSFWNPRLVMFINGGVDVSQSPVKGESSAGAGLQIASYGPTKVNPTVSIGQVGLAYSMVQQRAAVVVNPVSLNISSIVPGNLVKNTFIGPSIQVDTKADVSAGVSVSVGF